MQSAIIQRRHCAMSAPAIYIGTAGWSIPRAVTAEFSAAGTHLERYATQLSCAEINTTFYRPHQPKTFLRWANSVPHDFRFSVKIPKTITHEAKLVNTRALLAAFLEQISPLGEKLGALLVQLPPKLAFDRRVAIEFFGELRMQCSDSIAFEPRHSTWFTPEATRILTEYRIARVVADPAVVPDASIAAGTSEFVYVRLHGSPRVYYSAYDDANIDRVADTLRDARECGATAWCIFDNTASGAAAADALRLRRRMHSLAFEP